MQLVIVNAAILEESEMYFIIGASGFIGKHLYDYCIKQRIDVLGTYYKHSYCKEWVRFDVCTDNLCDITNGYLNSNELHTIIICAANSSIDGCKKNESDSNDLNIMGTKRIIEQADKMGIRCVFLSSETVFDGKRGMYTEEDIPNPITLYGKQKLIIEQYLAESVNDYLILRISRAVGSSYGENDIFNEFNNKIISNEEIVCLKNQSFCVTEINDIVLCIMKALEKNLRGLYHMSSNNYISRYELASLYAEKIFGGYGKIVEREYSEMQFLDNRHIYGGLDGNKLANLIEIDYMNIADILKHYMETYRKRKEIK